MADSPEPRDDATDRLLRAVEASKAWEESDASRGRSATPEERIAAFVELMTLAEAVVAARGFPHVPEPLRYPRLVTHKP